MLEIIFAVGVILLIAVNWQGSYEIFTGEEL